MVTNKLYVKTINKIALTLSITFCLTYILYEFKNIGSDNFYFLLLSATLPLVVLFTRLKKYNLIIMDLNMPILSGEETIKIIRELNIETPILVFTGNTNITSLENLEVNGFIYKPIEPIEVIKTIKKTINAN